jgi:hypothetical protein
MNYCSWGAGILVSFGVSIGVTLITTAMVKCCDSGSKTELKNIVISDIEEVEKSPVLKKRNTQHVW